MPPRAHPRMHSRTHCADRALAAVSLFALGFSLIAGGSTTAAPAAPRSQPNVVVILIDDLGWRDLGCYGNGIYETPHIDDLAAGGMRFTQAYSAAPVCSPSRAALLTGKYPVEVSFTGHITAIGRHRYPETGRVIPPADNMFLALDEVTLAEALKGRGYAAASVGKWHLGGPGYWPLDQGFDVNIAGWTSGSPPNHFYPYTRPASTWNAAIPTLEGGEPGEYLTDRLTDEAIRFIEQNRRQPFFLYLTHYAVHTPIQAPGALVEKYSARQSPVEFLNPAYAAMVEAVDQSVGRVLSTLERLDLADDTIVVFTSDNGGLAPVTSNAPLRAGKGFLYEGGIRVPLIVKWPGRVRPGGVSAEPVSGIDVMPTLLDMVRRHDGETTSRADDSRDFDGLSLMPLLLGERTKLERPLFWYYPHYSPQAKQPGAAVRRGDWKLIEHYDPPRVELYNLARDPGENVDLSRAQPEVRRDLAEQLHSWLEGVRGPRHQANPAHTSPSAERPNVIFIMTDDQADWALGASGNRDAYTPNLDRLAREGAMFVNAFVTTPVCSPSRASLLASRYSTELGVVDYLNDRPRGFRRGLDSTRPTWPRAFARGGFETSLVGKWHVGSEEWHHPARFGYQRFSGFRRGGYTSRDAQVEILGRVQTLSGYTADRLTDLAIEFVTQSRAAPFLLSLHYWAPHANTRERTPDGDRTWLPLKDEDWKRFERATPSLPHPNYPDLDRPRAARLMREYLGSVASVDRNVGRLLASLDELGLSDNTVVIYTSDHGYNLGHNGIWHKGNGRWLLTTTRDSRPNLYDTSLRVPAIVRWPRQIKPGTRIERTVTHLDWYPTLVALAGVELRGARGVRGRNLLPLLKGESVPWNDDLFVQYSMRHAEWAELRAYRTPEWKLVRDFRRSGKDELYDLANDPDERKNLIAVRDPTIRKRKKELAQRLWETMQAVDDPVARGVVQPVEME